MADPTVIEAYHVLGIEPGADRKRIREAYRTAAKRTHPDAGHGSEAQFKRVTDAYERLSERWED